MALFSIFSGNKLHVKNIISIFMFVCTTVPHENMNSLWNDVNNLLTICKCDLKYIESFIKVLFV